MSGPYLALIDEIAAYVPPQDREGYYEVLAILDRRLLAIAERPKKREPRAALHALMRANVNRWFAEQGLKIRF